MPDGNEANAFDDAAIERLRRAAEEVAWLTGRGYPLDTTSDLVARHHALTDAQRSALTRGTCSEPQYRRRAARELEAEDVARRPLAIDAADVVATIEAAIDGRPVLQTLDGTVRAFGIDGATFVPGPGTDAAIDRLLSAAKELRPSLVRFYLPEGSDDLRARIDARASAQKVKSETKLVADVRKALAKERQIVTGDADALDECAGWYNLAARVVETVTSAKLIRLQ